MLHVHVDPNKEIVEQEVNVVFSPPGFQINLSGAPPSKTNITVCVRAFVCVSVCARSQLLIFVWMCVCVLLLAPNTCREQACATGPVYFLASYKIKCKLSIHRQ